MPSLEKPSILITGASGFIGSFMVEKALEMGFSTWAAIRKGSSKKYLFKTGVNFIELDFDYPETLKQQLQGHSFDYVIHAAGVTKCLNKNDFLRVNHQGTINLVGALQKLKMPLKKFVFLSSLSVCGPIKEKRPYEDITLNDVPRPNTLYGASKLKAEEFLDKLKDFPFVTLRLTGVYGPREKDYYLMAKSIKYHFDFSLGSKPEALTFVYVKDAVEATFLALENGKVGSKYFISDGGVYTSRKFSSIIQKELGKSMVAHINFPIWMFRIITYIAEAYSRIIGQATLLNKDKFNILKQRNWRCDLSKAKDELGYSPKFDLSSGVKLTIAWYKQNRWL